MEINVHDKFFPLKEKKKKKRGMHSFTLRVNDFFLFDVILRIEKIK